MVDDLLPSSDAELEAATEGTMLWTPSDAVIARSNMLRYMRFLEQQKGKSFADYAALWRWSVSDLEGFWASIWEYYQVRATRPYSRVLAERKMPGARWFADALLNYAENALSRRDDEIAVIGRAEDGTRIELSRRELAERVAAARTGLRRLGVGRGDSVAAFMPNAPETLIAFLATASLGAVWSSCSPEFGVKSVLDRFQQIEPKVLLAVDGYRYGGKSFERTDAVQAIKNGLPTLQRTVVLSRLGKRALTGSDVISFDELCREQGELAFEQVSFEHPLWVLYSSGTTGLPKPIVHGHGGILIEHLKSVGLHCDLGPGDRFFWFTTTGWMMWNFLLGGLLVGATIVLYDGSPAHPDLDVLFELCEQERISYFGTSAPFLLACKKADLAPKGSHDFSALRAIGSTGAPLPADGFGWVYSRVSPELLLGSVSGGTDVCTAFVLSCPLLPVRAGQIQCRGLGCAVEAFDEHGHALEGEVGELVVTEPMPSMPTHFIGDPDGTRYRESYFSVYPGVWRHGDWIKLLPDGSSVIYGRSDSTLNRGGVRMGTSEFYRVVDNLPEIADSLVVDTGSLDDTDGKLWLFVVPRAGHALDDALKKRIADRLRSELSPRHVPDEIRAVAEIPRTLNGKKLEIPIKRILKGVPIGKAVNPDTLANPNALQAFVGLARGSGPRS